MRHAVMGGNLSDIEIDMTLRTPDDVVAFCRSLVGTEPGVGARESVNQVGLSSMCPFPSSVLYEASPA